MDGTYSQRDRRRAERWVDQSGGLTYVPPEAFGLLVRRLAARRRVQSWPLLLATLAMVLSVGVDLFQAAEPAGVGKTFAGRTLAAFALFAIAFVARERLVSRAEHRIGATLPHRVSRGTAVSVPMMLGRVRMTFLVAVITLDAALSVALLLNHRGWLAWTFSLAFAVASGCLVAGVWQAANRATVAVDPVSLAIDERLRSDDAFSATFPLAFLLFVPGELTSSTSGPGWLDVWRFGAALVFGLWTWATTSGPWRSRPIPRGSFLGRALRWVRS